MNGRIIDGMKRLIGSFDAVRERQPLERPMLAWSSVLYTVELARQGGSGNAEQLERVESILRGCEWMFGAWATLGYRSSYALGREMLAQATADLETASLATPAAAA